MVQSITGSFSAFMKTRYTTEHITNVTEMDRLTYALVPKDGNISGEEFDVPLIIGNPQGIGATRPLAQTGANQVNTGGNLQGKKWRLTFGDYKGSVVIDDKTMKAARDDQGAFFRAKGGEIDGLLEMLADHYSILMFSDSGHSVTPGTFTISTGVCTLLKPDDIVNIYLGMQLQVSANDGTSTGHALLGSGSIGYVYSIDYGAGTFIVSATDVVPGVAATPSGWTGTMFGFRSGDFGGGAAPTPIFFGFGAWLLNAAASATSFYGVDRSLSPFLQGVRLTATDIAGQGIDGRLKRLATRATGRYGGPGFSHLVMNPENWQTMADTMESKGIRPLDGKTATTGYQLLKVSYAGKTLEVIADRFCPIGTCFGLSMKHWKFRSYGPLIDLMRGDDNEMLRQATSDTYEVRVISYPNLATDAPSFSGRVTLP